jgi:hypothetical protein
MRPVHRNPGAGANARERRYPDADTEAGVTLRRLMAASALALLGAVAASPLNADDDAISISSRMIENFKVGSSQTRFGDFEFVGGLELSSSSSFLGAMSAIRLAEDRNRFLGVMDTGFWYAGRLERDDSGRMIGVEDFTVSPILDSLGNGSDEKWMFDAEGMVLRGDEVLVSFERRPPGRYLSRRSPGRGNTARVLAGPHSRVRIPGQPGSGNDRRCA